MFCILSYHLGSNFISNVGDTICSLHKVWLKICSSLQFKWLFLQELLVEIYIFLAPLFLDFRANSAEGSGKAATWINPTSCIQVVLFSPSNQLFTGNLGLLYYHGNLRWLEFDFRSYSSHLDGLRNSASLLWPLLRSLRARSGGNRGRDDGFKCRVLYTCRSHANKVLHLTFSSKEYLL